MQKPSKANAAAFERAIDEVSAATQASARRARDDRSRLATARSRPNGAAHGRRALRPRRLAALPAPPQLEAKRIAAREHGDAGLRPPEADDDAHRAACRPGGTRASATPRVRARSRRANGCRRARTRPRRTSSIVSRRGPTHSSTLPRSTSDSSTSAHASAPTNGEASRATSRRTTLPRTRTRTTTPMRTRAGRLPVCGGSVESRRRAVWSPGRAPRAAVAETRHRRPSTAEQRRGAPERREGGRRRAVARRVAGRARRPRIRPAPRGRRRRATRIRHLDDGECARPRAAAWPESRSARPARAATRPPPAARSAPAASASAERPRQAARCGAVHRPITVNVTVAV